MTIDPAIIIKTATWGLIAFAVTIVCWWTWRLLARRIRRPRTDRAPRPQGPLFSAVVLPLLYAAAHWVLIARPSNAGGSWRSLDGNTRIFLLAPAALLLGLLLSLPIPRFLRVIIMLAGGATVAFFVVGTVHPDYLGATNRWIWLVPS